MRIKLFGLSVNIFFVLLSSALLVVSFPHYDHGMLVWIALVPLLIALLEKGPCYSFIMAHVCGILLIAGTFYWILEIEKYTLLHHAILVCYYGFYVGTFGLVFSFISKRFGALTAFMAAPFIWVTLEFTKSNLSFLALPWILLSHTQYKHPLIIQIAAFTGAYGVSFLIVMVNSCIAVAVILLYNFMSAKAVGFTNLTFRSGVTIIILPTAVLLAAALFYGQKTLTDPIRGKSIRLSVVQGNIEQSKKWDQKYAKFIMQTYSDLTRKTLKDHPDLIVWPESATPGAVNRQRRLNAQVRHLVKEVSVPILLGSALERKFERDGDLKENFRNSAFLFSPEPRLIPYQRYDKIRLFPFGEYLPCEKTIPWKAIGVQKVHGFKPGEKHTVFEFPNFKFGATICWENIFPDLVRQFVKRGAQFIVNMTNEAWFGETAAPYQFVSMSVFRAVENRVFVVRCGNTGVSCIIDPHGRVVDRVKDENGRDIFVRDVMTGSIIPLKYKTFYTRYGDWPVWVCTVFSFVFILSALSKGYRFKGSGFRG